MSASSFRTAKTSGNLRKVTYSPEIGKARNTLFSEAFRRIDRAISAGFHLEAIALLESLICDRLEMAISIKLESSIRPGNLGPLLIQAKSLDIYSEELFEELHSWRRDRNQVLHQMVKITDSESSNWRERMKFARKTAIEGKEILNQIQVRNYRLKKDFLPKKIK
jgi:hypothetical protein